MKLGWRPLYDRPGRFDILPLVLQANGGTPEWFEIPKELILEINIVHPTLVHKHTNCSVLLHYILCMY